MSAPASAQTAQGWCYTDVQNPAHTAKVLHGLHTTQHSRPRGQDEIITCKKPWITFDTLFPQNKKVQLKPLLFTRHSPPPQYSLTEKNREILGSTKITHCTCRPA